MSERAQREPGASVGSDEESDPTGPVIRDKRRIDPQTGELRQPVDEPAARTRAGETTTEDTMSQPPYDGDQSAQPAAGEPAVAAEQTPDVDLAEDLRRDLQRLTAEYINYKRRVDRDRELHRDLAIGSVLEALLPVLDDVNLARQHGDLEGSPFAAISDKLDATLARFGVQRYGEPGVPFDPTEHEALMHTTAELPEGTQGPTVVQVLQPGYRINSRVVRAARVAVADPQE